MRIFDVFVIALGFSVSESKVVDLTHPLNDNDTMVMPIYNHFKFSILHRGWFDLPDDERAWVEFNEFTTPEHLGTHIDAPAHLTNSDINWKVHQIPVDHLIGDAVVIDITARAAVDPDASLLVSDLEEWEEEHGQIKDGSIVLMHSGWDQYWGNKMAFFGNDQDDSSNFHFPGFSVEASEWLVKNRVIHGVGVDTISIDNGNNFKYEAHRALLSENIYGLENMNNLGRLPPAGARLYAFPLKIKDGSGAPCRIVAEFNHLDDVEDVTTSKGSNMFALQASVIYFLLVIMGLVLVN